MIEPRFGSAAAVVNNTIYAFGGFGNTGTVERFQLSDDSNNNTNRWSKIKNKMTTARVEHCAVAVGDLIYLIGGCEPSNGEPLDSMEVFDTKTETFVSLSTRLPMPMANAPTVVVDKYIVITLVTYTLLFDTEAKVWKKIVTLPI